MLPFESSFSNDEITRYSKQMLVPSFGVDSQRKLSKSRALIVGIGGLGSPVAFYLVGGGVGSVTLVDFDVVEEGNLHRQIIHSSSMIGQLKIDSAYETLSRYSPHSNIEIVDHKISENDDKSEELVGDHDVIVDCSDDMKVKFLLNDLCLKHSKPLGWKRERE